MRNLMTMFWLTVVGASASVALMGCSSDGGSGPGGSGLDGEMCFNRIPGIYEECNYDADCAAQHAGYGHAYANIDGNTTYGCGDVHRTPEELLTIATRAGCVDYGSEMHPRDGGSFCPRDTNVWCCP